MKLKKIQLSSRDKKLLLIILALLVLIATYRFVYFENMQTANTIITDIKQLRVREAELQLKSANISKLEEENYTLINEMKDISDNYGTGATIEKTILFLKDLELESGMDISVIDFSDPEPIDTIQKTDNSTLSEDNNLVTGSESSLPQEEGSVIENGSSNSVSGYNSIVSIDFKVNYEGLKKSIDYINHSSERKNIHELNLVYDLETGNLSGSMKINMYHLVNTAMRYEEPAIAGVNIGTQNIFRTIEVPDS